MNWQKKARLGIAVFVILFVTFVVVALRHRRPPSAPSTSPRTDDKAVSQTVGRGVVEQKNKEGKVVFSIAFEGQSVYENGRTVLGDVKLTLPDRGGRAIEVTATRAEIVTPPGAGQRVGTAKLTGNVRMKTSDGITVAADEATYNETDATITVPGRVSFARGRMKGSGGGATYDQNRDVLWLLDQARVSVAADKQGGGAMDGTAGSAGFARADHYLRLSRAAHVVAEGRTIQADELTAYLTPDDEHIQTMELRGNSRITGSGNDVQAMAADNIDLTYAADGKTLQNSRLMQNAVLQLPGERGRTGRRISATAIDIAMAPDGKTVTNLNATEHVQVDLAAEGDQPARRVRSTALMAVGAPGTGLQNATFVDQVEFHETRAARRDQAAIDRTAHADRLIMDTKPGLGAIQQADFHGTVHFTDGTQTTAEAPRAIYRVDRDEITLSPGDSGEPGPAPNVNDGKVSVEARNIQLVLGTQKLKADTKVRSWLQAETKPAAAGTSGDQAARAAGAAPPPAKETGRVPSMLKQDEQVNVTSNRLEYDGSASLATYSGNANLWQGETTVKAATIVLDSKTGNLRATTTVSTVMLFEDLDPKTNQRKPTRTTATADTLVYEDAKRLATYTGNESARAHIAGAQGDLTGDRIDLYLKPDGNELDRMEVNGNVVVIESARTAKGNHLTYTSSDDRYVMTGTPVDVVEVTPPNCKKTIGATLTFKRSVSSIMVEGNGVYGQQSTPVACPAGRS